MFTLLIVNRTMSEHSNSKRKRRLVGPKAATFLMLAVAPVVVPDLRRGGM